MNTFMEPAAQPGPAQKAQRFVEALHELEEHGRVEQLVDLLADDVVIWTPHIRHVLAGREAGRHFWREYRGVFLVVHSEIREVLDDAQHTVVEWTSRGTLEANAQPFEYRGATVLEWTGGAIRRFAAYFDPTPISTAVTPEETGEMAGVPRANEDECGPEITS